MPRPQSYDRETALTRAVTLFWRKGYQGSSMKQIEQALDMRPGSIYATFGSKDRLFTEALGRYAEQSSQELAEHMARHDSIMEGFQTYLQQIASSCAEPFCTPARACLVVKTLLESSHANSALYAQAKAILTDIEDGFIALLETARKKGEIASTTDCRRLARLIQAQIMGLRSMAERDLPASELVRLGEDMATILNAYRLRN